MDRAVVLFRRRLIWWMLPPAAAARAAHAALPLTLAVDPQRLTRLVRPLVNSSLMELGLNPPGQGLPEVR